MKEGLNTSDLTLLSFCHFHTLMKNSFLLAVTVFLFNSCISPIDKAKTKDVSTIVTEKYMTDLKEALDSVNAAKKYIHEGDMICRTGFDYVSQTLQNFNTVDKTYSHSGLAFIEDGKIMVYHSIAGADENPDENFKKEPFDSFVDPKRKVCFGIFRYKLTPEEIGCVALNFKDLEKRHVKFDKFFNLKDDDKQYCSEAIAKTLKKCTNSRIIIPTTIKENINIKNRGYEFLKGKRFEYISLDNLYLNPYCDSIKKVTYKIGYAKPLQ